MLKGMGNNKNDKQVVKEVTEYRGDLRVLGKVMKGTSHVGFVLLEVATGQVRPFTTQKVLSLAKTTRFENARHNGVALEFTEHADSRFPEFSTQMVLQSGSAVMVLAALETQGVVLGYRVIDTEFKVRNLKENDLIKLAKSGVSLVNAKVVERGGTEFISAIRSEFKRISQEKVSSADEKHVKTVLHQRHENFRGKALIHFVTEVLRSGSVKEPQSRLTRKMFSVFLREVVFAEKPDWKLLVPDLESKTYRHVALGLVTAYIIDMIESKRPYTANYQLQKYDLQALINEHPHFARFSYKRNIYLFRRQKRGHSVERKFEPIATVVLETLAKDESMKASLAYCVDLNKMLTKKTRRAKSNYPYTHARVELLSKALYAAAPLFSFRVEDEEDYPRRYKVDYTVGDIDFMDVEGVKQMGYTLDPAEVGTHFQSPVYGNIKLRDAFAFIPNLSEGKRDALIHLINCFGDIQLLRDLFNLDKTAYKGGVWDTWDQSVFVVLCLYNSRLAQFVVDNWGDTFGGIEPITGRLQEIKDMNPNIFEEHPEENIYYLSGCRFNTVDYKTRTNSAWENPYSYGNSIHPDAHNTAPPIIASVIEYFVEKPCLVRPMAYAFKNRKV